MKVMVFTPTWLLPDGTPAISPECRDSVTAQRVDCEWEWFIGTENPYPVPDHRNVLHQYQKARESFLAGDWDALLLIEHDNVLPDDFAMQRILDTDAPVVYGIYALRHGLKMLSAWRYDNDRNIGMSMTNYPRELAQAKTAGVWRISGIGFGCTLMRRDVVERIPFRAGLISPVGGPQDAPDIPFAEDALHLGVISLGRFDVPVGHVDKGHVMWPYDDFMDKTKYMARENTRVMVGGRSLQLRVNELVDLTDDEYAEICRLGIVEPWQEPRAAAPVVEKAVVAPVETADVPAYRKPSGNRRTTVKAK